MSTERPLSLFLLLIILIFGWSLLFPALNWPDEIYKLNRVHLDDNLYAKLLSYLRPQTCFVQVLPTGHTGYLANELHYTTRGDLTCYNVYKAINAVIFLLLAAGGIRLLKHRIARLSFMLALIWPSILFYSSSINQQTVFVVVSVFCVASTLTSKRIWPFLLLSIALLPIDRSFISLSIFLSVLMVLSWKPRAVVPLAILVVLLQTVLNPFLLSYSGDAIDIGSAESIGELSNSLARLQDPIWVDFALLLLSFVYLGGTNTLIGIGLDYAITFIFLGMAILNQKGDRRFWAYIYAFLITYLFVVSVIPSLQTFRYYIYIAPALLYFFVNTPDLRKKFTIYCVIMSVCYLGLANA